MSMPCGAVLNPVLLIEPELKVVVLEGPRLLGPVTDEFVGSRLCAELADFIPPSRAAHVLVE